jgi:hypothetical protein
MKLDGVPDRNGSTLKEHWRIPPGGNCPQDGFFHVRQRFEHAAGGDSALLRQSTLQQHGALHSRFGRLARVFDAGSFKTASNTAAPLPLPLGATF